MQCYTAVEPTRVPIEQRMSASVSFGPFRLFPTGRLLEMNGRPFALGNRALDILITLVERAGEVVSQQELMRRVWRGLVVSPGNLRVHMNALRNAFRDSAGKLRYVVNVKGQGYCFVAPIQRHDLPLASAGLIARFARAVRCIELGAVTDPAVLSQLRGARMLLVFDDGERVMDAAAALAGPGCGEVPALENAPVSSRATAQGGRS